MAEYRLEVFEHREGSDTLVRRFGLTFLAKHDREAIAIAEAIFPENESYLSPGGQLFLREADRLVYARLQ
jgi:hypothetical protein